MSEQSEWTTETLRKYMLARLEDLRSALDERHQAQLRAIDAAMASADRAVEAALLAAEKAVHKAEIAADKRFDSVNEFRAQLTDQATRFISRDEYFTAHQALLDKLETEDARNNERMSDLTSRMDRNEGSDSGAKANTSERRLDFGVVLQSAALFMTMIGLLIVAFHK